MTEPRKTIQPKRNDCTANDAVRGGAGRMPALTRRSLLGRLCGTAFLGTGIWGCTSVGERRDLLPERNAKTYDQLVIHSNIDLPEQHRLLEDLRVLRIDLLQTLALPASDEPIHVYLFETEQAFGDFMRRKHPNFPTRRAFFVESDTKLSVFAYWGDRVAEDLRHETTHGYLHSVVRNTPLWLDEGIAEYFEVPRGAGGLNPPHAQQLLSLLITQGRRPDMARLETLTSVGDMRQEDYAESWAWVHWLLNTEPERRTVLQQFLQSLRSQALYVPISAVVKTRWPQAERELCDHLFAIGKPNV